MPSERKTSVTLAAHSVSAYEMARASEPDLTLNEFVNRAIALYQKHQGATDTELLMTHLKAIRKTVDALESRDAPQISPVMAELAQLRALVQALTPTASQISAVPHVPWWRQWWRRTRTVEHW